MDENEINDLIQKCRKLKYKFCGVFAANNFPQKRHKNSFLIVNASPSNNPGTHWLLLCNRNNKIILRTPWDNRLLPIETYITDSLTLMHNYVNFSNTNQFRVKTQNCVDFFVIILRLLYLVKDKLQKLMMFNCFALHFI